MTALNYNASYACPECGAATTAKLQQPLVICCASCRAVFSVRDDIVQNEDFKWNISNEISVIKLGTKGVFKGQSFEIIGRARSVDTMAISNEWLMDFGSNNFGWLTESGCMYFVMDSKPIAVPVLDIKGKKAGSIIRISGKDYFVMEVSKQVNFKLEGQIPYDAYNDEEYFKYELKASDNSGYATVCIFDKNTVEAFTGNKIDPEELKLTAINDYNDWK